MDHTKLLYDIGELTNLFSDSASIEILLERTVAMVAHHLGAEVCSIYVYDEEKQVLVLRATHGLDRSAIGRVTLRPGEGLTGLAVEELKPVCVSNASKHPRYRFFAGTNEELYDKFLAVPLRRGIHRIGALVVQRQKRRFTQDDIMACQAAASQLATIIENARFLIAIHEPPAERREAPAAAPSQFVRCHVAAEGYAYAPSLVMDFERSIAAVAERPWDGPCSLADFRAAVVATENQLRDLQQRVEETLTDAASLIFATHLLILKDNEFLGAMEKRVEAGEEPQRAIVGVARKFCEVLNASRNPYVREKTQDVEDLVLRLLDNLRGASRELSHYQGRIVIARDLFPSDLLKLASERVAGVILVGGGATSHIAILARSLSVPMVMVSDSGLLAIPDGTHLLLDAETGVLYVNPAREAVEAFEARNRARAAVAAEDRIPRPESRTADGERVQLLVNINLLSDLRLACKVQAEGIGLYRTEFPFIVRNTLPTEEEQYVTYRRLVDGMPGKPVTFRTLDIGGDKILSYFQTGKEENPCLGMRSIRFSLRHRDIFADQIRAILRAGSDADIGIMFPMVSSLEELEDARRLVGDCIVALSHAAIPHCEHPRIGMMVELPSAVDLIEDFAREADFLSIGTNDLIQFILGVDRTNENVADFYLPHHPAVLRALNRIAQAALRGGRGVSICGDMAHQTEYLPFLIGIGIRTLSVDPLYVPRVQEAIARIDSGKAAALANAVLRETSVPTIARMLIGAPRAEPGLPAVPEEDLNA